MAKVIHCPCGTDVQGETDDELVAAVEQHVQEHHPDQVGKMSRENILEGAHASKLSLPRDVGDAWDATVRIYTCPASAGVERSLVQIQSPR
ncbi:MAG: DUF1059 domain-containing protein [Solirubrobacterales bacterium]